MIYFMLNFPKYSSMRMYCFTIRIKMQFKNNYFTNI